MKKVLKKCDKCGQATEDIDICDNCGNEIASESQQDIILTIERPMYDDGDEWTFQFCSIECMIKWMQNRKIDKKCKSPSIVPYEWEDEIRKTFDIPL